MDFQPWLAGKSPRWAEVLVVNSGIVQQTMFYKGIREPQEKTREHMCFFVPDVFFYSCFSSITLMTSWWPASSIKWCGKLTVNHPTFCQERMVTTIPQLEVLVRFTRLFWFILIHLDSFWFILILGWTVAPARVRRDSAGLVHGDPHHVPPRLQVGDSNTLQCLPAAASDGDLNRFDGKLNAGYKLREWVSRSFASKLCGNRYTL